MTGKSLGFAAGQAFWATRPVTVKIDNDSSDEVFEASLAKLEAFVGKPESAGRVQMLDLSVSIQYLEAEKLERVQKILGNALRALKGLRSIR